MNTRSLAARLALLVGGSILAAPTLAQGQGGGQGGGFRGRMPFLMGNVTAVNAQAGTLTVQPQFGGGDPQTVQISTQTQMMTQEAAAVADLKVGDTIQVQGVPTALTASTITIGQMPNMFGGRPGGAGGPGGGGGAQGGAARAGRAGGPGQAANASASGKITSLSPLTIALADSATLTLKLASDAKLTRLKTVALSGVKVGDQVVASGQAGQDGTFAANMVGVNMQMGGMMGGFGGGGRGYNGPRGFGGPPPPAPAAPPQN